MDRNKDGVVTIEEFIESCKKVGQESGFSRPGGIILFHNVAIALVQILYYLN